METPQMTASSYASTVFDFDKLMAANAVNAVGGVVGQPLGVARALEFPQPRPIANNKEPEVMSTRRLIQVLIADPNENVPLDMCLLHKGEQKLTDLTDQELFFEIDIKTILDAHNTKRVLLVDKKVKERTENLEPARIRDLKMTVVTVAQF